MTIEQARSAAQLWMQQEACSVPGFCGAYTAGSTNWLAASASLPSSSDLDVMVVVNEAAQAGSRRKFVHKGVLIEGSYLHRDDLQSPSRVLGDYHLAPSFATTQAMFDPLGLLTPLLHVVRGDYPKKIWVKRRCTNVEERILRTMRSLDLEAQHHDQATSCLFAAGMVTHILLVAGLRNPTVRTRYEAVKELLSDYGHPQFHEVLLELLGTAQMDQSRARQHLDALAKVFEAAALAIKSPFPFAADIGGWARVAAIERSADLIDSGHHREAMFWVAVTRSRCQKILSTDAPNKITNEISNSYKELLADIGLHNASGVRNRCREVKEALPRIQNLADRIISANNEISPQ